jgi:hypothetical protein
MVIFAFALAELRRSLRRAEEARQLLLASMAVSDSNFDVEKLSQIRLATFVSEDAGRIKRDSVEQFTTSESMGTMRYVLDMFSKNSGREHSADPDRA